MKRYNIEELKTKLERYRNIKLEDVDEISSIKIIEENQAMKEYWIV